MTLTLIYIVTVPNDSKEFIRRSLFIKKLLIQ